MQAVAPGGYRQAIVVAGTGSSVSFSFGLADAIMIKRGGAGDFIVTLESNATVNLGALDVIGTIIPIVCKAVNTPINNDIVALKL